MRAEWILDLPHPVLFQRFAASLGVDTSAQVAGSENDNVVCWREMFMTVLAHGSPAEAVGALGLGTENIVSTIYQPFVGQTSSRRVLAMEQLSTRPPLAWVASCL